MTCPSGEKREWNGMDKLLSTTGWPLCRREEVPVLIDLTPQDAGTRYPSPIFGEDAADLVDIDFLHAPLPSDPVDIDCCRKGLLADDQRIKLDLQGRAVAVQQWLNCETGRETTLPDKFLQRRLAFGKWPDRVGLPPCEVIGRQPDCHFTIPSGKGKRPGNQTAMPIVQGIECPSHHHTHMIRPPVLV